MKKIIITLVLWGSSAFDAQTTIHRGPHTTECNPILGRHPSDLRLTLTGSAIIASETVLLWKLHTKRKKLREAVDAGLLTQSVTHIALGIHNTKVK